ncbi:hypothetical protein EGR_06389 [Echinococcus granulosus]|uniref:Uncharacterized protein n=1 Tax=Echinococcus granulosus TaxID=6210 RepID=W6UBG7_ECHGR|nr:hypothetical protein EGR_06389 [Echinococcus granulosus]EUB58718.1 hypothetical protein EGR_06389 [Echinococcus granulosus]
MEVMLPPYRDAVKCSAVVFVELWKDMHIADSRHRRRIRQLIEGYQKSRSKVYCSGKTLFSPLEAWSQDFEYHSNMSQSSEYARVKRGLMALEGETPQTIGLTTFTRPSRGDLVDTSQLYTQSQLPLSTFPRPPKSAHQRIGAYMDDHQTADCQNASWWYDIRGGRVHSGSSAAGSSRIHSTYRGCTLFEFPPPQRLSDKDQGLEQTLGAYLSLDCSQAWTTNERQQYHPEPLADSGSQLASHHFSGIQAHSQKYQFAAFTDFGESTSFRKGTSFSLAKTCCTAVTDTTNLDLLPHTDAKLVGKVIHPSAKVAEEKHTFLPSITSTCPKYFSFSSIQRPHVEYTDN